MDNIYYLILQSIINSLPILMAICFVYITFRGPISKFVTKNLLDSGGDKYNNPSNEDIPTNKNNTTIPEDEIISLVNKTLVDTAGKKYFDEYKEKLESFISLRQSELTNHALSSFYSESKIEKEITDSLAKTIDNKTKSLIRESTTFKELEKNTLDKINLIKVSSFLEHLEKEYDATRSTKALMSNIFIIVNAIYFIGLLSYLIFGKSVSATPSIYLALSCSYIGLGAFVVYMIKFCNARSLTLLSLREDFLKRDATSSIANKMVDLGTNEHHVALLQLMNSGVATKEQKINHPYEMLLYGIKDSNIMFKGGKFEIKKESHEKSASK